MLRLTSNGSARYTADIRAIDTKVLKLTRAHTAEFRDGLTIFAPCIKRASYVHNDHLSKGLLTPAPVLKFQRRFDGWNIGLPALVDKSQGVTSAMRFGNRSVQG